MLFIPAMHVIPLQGKEIMHLISDLFLEFKFFDEQGKFNEFISPDEGLFERNM